MARLKWFEVPFGGAAGHHLPGCDGQCGGECSAEMDRAWTRRPLPASSEAVDPDRTLTSPLGVELMETVVNEGLR